MSTDNTPPEERRNLLNLSKEEIKKRLHQAKALNIFMKRTGTVTAEQLDARIHHLAMAHPTIREKAREWGNTLKVARLSQDLSMVRDVEHELHAFRKENNIDEPWWDRERINEKVVDEHIDSIAKSLKKDEGS